MNIIPENNLFLISSAIQTPHGTFDIGTRFDQTLATINSIKSYVDNPIICLFDSSPKLDDKVAYEIQRNVNIFVPLQNQSDIMQLSAAGHKSPAECMSTFKTLLILKQNIETNKILNSVKRIFKISGRYQVRNTFDNRVYDNMFGKYVFRKRIPSWMPVPRQQATLATDLLVTRLYSFCPSLYDEYLQTLPKVFKDCFETGIDYEHGMFKYINKSNLVELETIHCQGQVANTGEMHYD